MGRKWVGVLLVLCVGILGLSGCGKSSGTDDSSSSNYAVLQDDLGRSVTLPSKPQRVVVLSASFLEPFYAVGGQVVGRPDAKTKLPDYAKDIPSVGAVYQIDMEKVLALKPDLVIVNKGMNEKLLGTLEQNKIPAIVIDMKSYADVKREIGIFAKITGETDKGNALVKEMDAKMAAIGQKLPKDKKRVAILHSTAQGISIQLKGSIAGSVADMLGFENVAADMTPLKGNADAAPYSLETLVKQNPEILFITSMGKMDEIKKSMQKTMQDSPAWQTIPAVQKGKVFYLPQDLFLLSPGIHYPEAMETMAKLVYPECFQ